MKSGGQLKIPAFRYPANIVGGSNVKLRAMVEAAETRYIEVRCASYTRGANPPLIRWPFSPGSSPIPAPTSGPDPEGVTGGGGGGRSPDIDRIKAELQGRDSSTTVGQIIGDQYQRKILIANYEGRVVELPVFNCESESGVLQDMARSELKALYERISDTPERWKPFDKFLYSRSPAEGISSEFRKVVILADLGDGVDGVVDDVGNLIWFNSDVHLNKAQWNKLMRYWNAGAASRRTALMSYDRFCVDLLTEPTVHHLCVFGPGAPGYMIDPFPSFNQFHMGSLLVSLSRELGCPSAEARTSSKIKLDIDSNYGSLTASLHGTNQNPIASLVLTGFRKNIRGEVLLEKVEIEQINNDEPYLGLKEELNHVMDFVKKRIQDYNESLFTISPAAASPLVSPVLALDDLPQQRREPEIARRRAPVVPVQAREFQGHDGGTVFMGETDRMMTVAMKAWRVEKKRKAVFSLKFVSRLLEGEPLEAKESPIAFGSTPSDVRVTWEPRVILVPDPKRLGQKKEEKRYDYVLRIDGERERLTIGRLNSASAGRADVEIGAQEGLPADDVRNLLKYLPRNGLTIALKRRADGKSVYVLEKPQTDNEVVVDLGTGEADDQVMMSTVDSQDGLELIPKVGSPYVVIQSGKLRFAFGGNLQPRIGDGR